MHYVYRTINIINYKAYIGITKNPISSGYVGSGSNIKKDIKKFGKSFFLRADIFSGSLEEAAKMEEFLIAQYNATEDLDFYNIRPGGNYSTHSIETRKKMSECKTGIKMNLTINEREARSMRAKDTIAKQQPKSDNQKAKTRWGALKSKFSKIPVVSDDMRMMHDYYGVGIAVKNIPPEKLAAFLDFRFKMLLEELTEGQDAIKEKDADEVVDALIDLTVIAVGTLDLLGVDFKKAWYRVLTANMNKRVGIKEGRPNPLNLPDLIKEPGWQAPSHLDNLGILPTIFKQ